MGQAAAYPKKTQGLLNTSVSQLVQDISNKKLIFLLRPITCCTKRTHVAPNGLQTTVLPLLLPPPSPLKYWEAPRPIQAPSLVCSIQDILFDNPEA